MENKKRLFHIENLGIMRDVVKKFLENDTGIELIQYQGDCHEIMQQLKDHKVDILLLGNADPECERFNYPELCKTVRDQFPEIKIIVHSVYSSSSLISKTMNAGAYGFVTHDMGFEDIIGAINAVKKDERYISKQISNFFRNTFEFLAGFAERLEQKSALFTNRELEVLEQVAKGLTTKEIASMLHISLKTVETHRKNLVTKAKVKNTAELIAYSGNYGFISS